MSEQSLTEFPKVAAALKDKGTLALFWNYYPDPGNPFFQALAGQATNFTNADTAGVTAIRINWESAGAPPDDIPETNEPPTWLLALVLNLLLLVLIVLFRKKKK